MDPSPQLEVVGIEPFSLRKLVMLSGIEKGTLLTDDDSALFFSGVLGRRSDIHSIGNQQSESHIVEDSYDRITLQPVRSSWKRGCCRRCTPPRPFHWRVQ